MNIKELLSEKIKKSLIAAGAPHTSKVQIQKSTKIEFGHYQVNSIMGIAKSIKTNPKKLAEKVIKSLHINDISNKIEIAGPGFINIFLEPKWIEKQITKILFSKKEGITPIIKKQTIVIDYSSPNIAKEMHVGHLRSTIIGDASARILSCLGHKVIKVNHVGDWGTQFGMLIAYLSEKKIIINNNKNFKISDLENFYREAKKLYDQDDRFAQLSRNYVVKLQNGDDYCNNIWKSIVKITMQENQKIYNKLNISLTKNNIMGESKYKDMLPTIIQDLKEKKIAKKHNGATVVFINKYKNKQGKKMGVIIQKTDGAYLYITTDIACIKYRYETLKANKIIYYVDSRQHQHLMQAWIIAQKAGYIDKTIPLEHHMFGMILNENGKPLKTRSGQNIKLVELLNESLIRAQKIILKKNPDIDTVKLKKLAKIIGISAIKYSELSKNRTTNYIFNWNNILNFEGNTAPYIQYTYTRTQSIYKKIEKEKKEIPKNIILQNKEEILLAICILQFDETITTSGNNGTPHILCDYIYNLSVLFSAFYENCPIIKETNEKIKYSRLQLTILTGKIIKKGLNLLGIKTTESM